MHLKKPSGDTWENHSAFAMSKIHTNTHLIAGDYLQFQTISNLIAIDPVLPQQTLQQIA
jgi:hypothetical protein